MLLKRGILLVAVLALLAAACGDDAASDDGDTGGGTATSSSIDATVTEFAFAPSSWAVSSGASVTVNLTNDGAVEHNLVVVVAGKTVTDAAELADSDMLIKVDALAGASGQGSFTAPAAGTYQVICAIPGHLPAGMEGTLTVS